LYKGGSMSFRNTFITDFIYSADDKGLKANPKVEKVFEEHGITLDNKVGANGYGYYSGIIKTSELHCMLSELQIEELIWDLEKVTRVPFRLTILQESGAVITYNVEVASK